MRELAAQEAVIGRIGECLESVEEDTARGKSSLGSANKMAKSNQKTRFIVAIVVIVVVLIIVSSVLAKFAPLLFTVALLKK